MFLGPVCCWHMCSICKAITLRCAQGSGGHPAAGAGGAGAAGEAGEGAADAAGGLAGQWVGAGWGR